MTKFVKMNDHSGEGTLVVNAKDRAIKFVNGRAAMDNAMFEELKAYHGEDRFSEDAAYKAEVEKNAHQQYDKKGKMLAEAVTDAIVNEGINTTAPVSLDGAFTTTVSPDEESPTVVAIEQAALSGELEEEDERDEKRAETHRKATAEREKKTHEAMLDQEAEAIGVPRSEFKVDASTEPAPKSHNTGTTDTQAKQTHAAKEKESK